MLISTSKSTLKFLIQTARAQAVAGASAGMALGLIRGIIAVQYKQLRDGYEVAAEGLTHVGTGAILGILGATAASVAGVSVAAITGPSLLTRAAPTIASTVVTGSVQEYVDRLVRPWSNHVVIRIRRAVQGPEWSDPSSKLPPPN